MVQRRPRLARDVLGHAPAFAGRRIISALLIRCSQPLDEKHLRPTPAPKSFRLSRRPVHAAKTRLSGAKVQQLLEGGLVGPFDLRAMKREVLRFRVDRMSCHVIMA